jgi:hypothetical protein
MRNPRAEFSMNCRKDLFRERAMNIDRDMGMGTAYSRTTRISLLFEETLRQFPSSNVLEVEGNHG